MDKTRKDVARTSKRLHLGLKILKEIISKGKSDNNKCGLSYISKVKTPISMKTTFVNAKEVALSMEASSTATFFYTI